MEFSCRGSLRLEAAIRARMHVDYTLNTKLVRPQANRGDTSGEYPIMMARTLCTHQQTFRSVSETAKEDERYKRPEELMRTNTANNISAEMFQLLLLNRHQRNE